MTKGRPVDPNSERAREPWKKFGMSRASFYWKKKYGVLSMAINVFKIDVHTMPFVGGSRNAILHLVRKHPDYRSLLRAKGWTSDGLRIPHIRWLLKKMRLTGRANKILATFMKVAKSEFPFADEPDVGVEPPSYQISDRVRAAVQLYDAYDEQMKADLCDALRWDEARLIFSPIPSA